MQPQAGAKIRANCGSPELASLVLLDIRECSRQTSLPKRVCARHLLSRSITLLVPLPASLALNVRYRDTRYAPFYEAPSTVLLLLSASLLEFARYRVGIFECRGKISLFISTLRENFF